MILLLAALQHGEEAAGDPNIFNIALGVSFWTVFIFLVLLWVLYKFAYPHILGAVEAREQRIQEALDEAKELRDEAEVRAAEQRQALEEARGHAQEIVAEGREAAERIRREIEERARGEADELLDRARREIEREKESALDDLRREAVDLAVAAASKLVEERLDEAKDREFVSRYLDRVTERQRQRS